MTAITKFYEQHKKIADRTIDIWIWSTWAALLVLLGFMLGVIYVQR